MMFIAYLFFFLVYLGFSVFVVRRVVAAARRRGRKAWKWGLPVALVLYLIPFWDHVPTLVIHKYLCATKAGLWVYKTPEEWKKENARVLADLTWQDISPHFATGEVDYGLRLNQRINYERRVSTVPVFPVNIEHTLLKDIATGDVLVRQVTVWSGYDSHHVKRWLGRKICGPNAKTFGRLKKEYKEIGRSTE